MTTTLQVLNLFYLVSILTSLGAHGVKIQAYQCRNFTGLAWESSFTAACTNIPITEQAFVWTIRTDTCFIARDVLNVEHSWSVKYMPGDISLYSIDTERQHTIRSLQLCNDEEGGNQLNIDITMFRILYYRTSPGPLLASYRNVCSCVNVPTNVQNIAKWSINNHHNAMWAYYERDCQENNWNPVFMAAGNNWKSRHAYRYIKWDSVVNNYVKYRSFGPDRRSAYFQTSCISSLVSTTESIIKTGENLIDSADFDKRLEALGNQFVELQRNQTNFQSDFRKEQAAYFTKLTEAFAELKQELRMLTEKN